MVKSTWPGVSIILMTWSPHLVKVAADWMVMPRCRSNSMLSIVAPTPSLPFTCTVQSLNGSLTSKSLSSSSVGVALFSYYMLNSIINIFKTYRYRYEFMCLEWGDLYTVFFIYLTIMSFSFYFTSW